MAAKPDTSSCGSCRFFKPEEGKGLCRRFPPTSTVLNVIGPQMETAVSYPTMVPEGWCGEYLPGKQHS